MVTILDLIFDSLILKDWQEFLQVQIFYIVSQLKWAHI